MTSRHMALNRYLTRWVLGVLWGVAAMATAAAATLELPPLVQPATGDHHPGKIIWTDLLTSDLAGAKRFYGGLFGWTFRDVRGGGKDFSLALLDGVPVGGMLQRITRPGEQRQPAWLTFISVPDVAEAQRKILSLGGKMLSVPRTYAQRGEQAIFTDPQGAVFAILHSTSGDPGDELADPGEWIWSSLVTRDPGAGAGFYQALFGYDAFSLPREGGAEHILLSSEDYARASVNPFPHSNSGLHPHWLNFVRVVNVNDAVAKVKALGGQVLVAPYPDRHNGLVAVVADPAGAPFGLLEWTEADTKEVTK